MDDAIAACESVISILSVAAVPVSPSMPTLTRAFADVWSRMALGMPREWRARAAWNWVDYLAGNIAELSDRRTSADHDSHSWMRLRRRTIGMWSSLDLAERLNRAPVPAPAWHSSYLKEMGEWRCEPRPDRRR